MSEIQTHETELLEKESMSSPKANDTRKRCLFRQYCTLHVEEYIYPVLLKSPTPATPPPKTEVLLLNQWWGQSTLTFLQVRKHCLEFVVFHSAVETPAAAREPQRHFLYLLSSSSLSLHLQWKSQTLTTNIFIDPWEPLGTIKGTFNPGKKLLYMPKSSFHTEHALELVAGLLLLSNIWAN